MGEEYEPCHSLSVCVILVEYEPYSHSGSWLVSDCDERVKRDCDERVKRACDERGKSRFGLVLGVCDQTTLSSAPLPFLLLLFVAFCIFFCRCSQTFSAYLPKRVGYRCRESSQIFFFKRI